MTAMSVRLPLCMVERDEIRTQQKQNWRLMKANLFNQVPLRRQSIWMKPLPVNVEGKIHLQGNRVSPEHLIGIAVPRTHREWILITIKTMLTERLISNLYLGPEQPVERLNVLPISTFCQFPLPSNAASLLFGLSSHDFQSGEHFSQSARADSQKLSILMYLGGIFVHKKTSRKHNPLITVSHVACSSFTQVHVNLWNHAWFWWRLEPHWQCMQVKTSKIVLWKSLNIFQTSQNNLANNVVQNDFVMVTAS